MTHVMADRVKEATVTVGTGAFVLTGANATFKTFASMMTEADTTFYAIVHATADEWEVGVGTYDATGNTLARTTIIKSTNADAVVDFSSGTKNIFMNYPADKAAFIDPTGKMNLPVVGDQNGGILMGSVGFFPFGSTGGYGDPTFQNQIPNQATILRVIPNGSSTISQFEFFGKDFFADPDNWENFRIVSGTTYLFETRTASGGTGIARAMEFRVNGSVNADQLVLETDGSVLMSGALILTNTPTTDPLNAGQVWSDAGTLKLSAG